MLIKDSKYIARLVQSGNSEFFRKEKSAFMTPYFPQPISTNEVDN